MKVYVKTPARLHLGIIDLNGGVGRIFGGIGVAISSPNVVIEAQTSDEIEVLGEGEALVRPLVKRFLEAYNLKADIRINVRRLIPQHMGLGSGTQLALAVATALAKLLNIDKPTSELAYIMGRGRISGVGTAVFEHGGFVVEGGLRNKTEGRDTRVLSREGLSPLIFHRPFPEDWFFVVAVPNLKPRFTDEEEWPVFMQLPPMPAREVGKICRLIIMKLLPSLIERDIEGFGEALTCIQKITGNFFAAVQGGPYSDPIIGECISYMLDKGAYGAGQSSWGPTFYGLVKGRKQAEELQSSLQCLIDSKVGGRVFHVKADNRGAYVRLSTGQVSLK
ncbi:MAG: beta-ribofuranosylaminobenzene 5'-phosphate synthase family protein [Candidatus Bathyarchaeia archaeon]